MKNERPSCPYPETGAKYWRGPEELADTPEFRAWVEQEFPAGAEEMKDGSSRRDFVKLMSASFMLAGLGVFGVGCRRPEEEILPFANQPEGYVHGVPQYYATAMPTRLGAIPLLARSSDGRPTKVEGNSQVPGSNGGTDVYAQASVLNVYDPDRARRVTKNGNKASQLAGFDALAAIADKFSANGGEGLSFLEEHGNSPSRKRVESELKKKFPKSKWYAFEPVDFDIRRRSATFAYGKPVTPRYNLAKASVILSLECDFLSTEEGMERFNRDFAKSRKLTAEHTEMSRLYSVEGAMTLTGGSADHRLNVPSSQVIKAASQIANLVLSASGVSGNQIGDLNAAVVNIGKSLSSANAAVDWVKGCAEDLLANKGKAVVIAGYQQPYEVHLLAHALNAALGAIGTTVELIPAEDSGKGSIAELATELNGGSVDTLVISGSNPVYTAPSDLNWAATQAKAATVARLGYYEDETAEKSTWNFALAHYLESWGDAHTVDGVLLVVQPLIKPLFGGITELEFLSRIGGFTKTNPYDVVRETFGGIVGGVFAENNWRQFLHDGYLPDTAYKTTDGFAQWGLIADEVKNATVAEAPSTSNLEVAFARDACVDDGRYTNNGWLQELPDPVTKVTWENVISMSKQTAKDLGVFPKYWSEGGATDEFKKLEEYSNLLGKGQTFASLVRLKLDGKEVVGPLWIQPGLANNMVLLNLGYGRKKAGRIGDGSGYDAYSLRTTKKLWNNSGATVAVEKDLYPIACTQSHWTMEGRPIVREANLSQYKEFPKFATAMNGHEMPGGNHSLYPNPIAEMAKANGVVHQWGMAIDLNSCTGCSACVIACQSENNIPIVGKTQVSKSREMHWIRIDRYFAGPFEAPQMTNQPMLCQHCENAPCESVCPVNATVHNEEGLNVMAYNRCVGTRYCSNNCPYKVRRYNFFDYNKRSLKELVGPIYSTPILSSTDGKWNLANWWKDPNESHMRPDDEWELLKLVKNPDLSVRMRGVMEKCSFCLQRIEKAKIGQKVKARESGDVAIPDGQLKTACQQACPAEAISFGNLVDEHSVVSVQKGNPRNYSVLDYLHTKPRVTYLAKVRNPNASMPDFKEYPISTVEYQKVNGVNGNPYEAHHGGGHGADHGHEDRHATEAAQDEKGSH